MPAERGRRVVTALKPGSAPMVLSQGRDRADAFPGGPGPPWCSSPRSPTVGVHGESGCMRLPRRACGRSRRSLRYEARRGADPDGGHNGVSPGRGGHPRSFDHRGQRYDQPLPPPGCVGRPRWPTRCCGAVEAGPGRGYFLPRLAEPCRPGSTGGGHRRCSTGSPPGSGLTDPAAPGLAEAGVRPGGQAGGP